MQRIHDLGTHCWLIQALWIIQFRVAFTEIRNLQNWSSYSMKVSNFLSLPDLTENKINRNKRHRCVRRLHELAKVLAVSLLHDNLYEMQVRWVKYYNNPIFFSLAFLSPGYCSYYYMLLCLYIHNDLYTYNNTQTIVTIALESLFLVWKIDS